MAVDERARHALHSRLEEMLGPEVTGTLMELLPPVTWADVATAHDVARGQAALGDRLDARIADVRMEIADLRTEVADFRTDLRTEMAGLHTHVDAELADVRIEMAGEFRQMDGELALAQRQLLFGVLGAMFTLTGLVWAIVGFSS